MYFINACSSISHQSSFRNKLWMNELQPLLDSSTLISPDYKEFVDAASLRRMSTILRMGLACAKDCVQQADIENPDAIIVGTGLGCLTDTEKFLKNTITISGLIPPTSFIQSTHNTIAGQISLALKNHNYNMTHTQNSLSFEHALIDAMLCLNEGKNAVLVGAADEKIPLMDELAEAFGKSEIAQKMTSGASFFMLSNTQNSTTKAALIDSCAIGLNAASNDEVITRFLKNNHLLLSDIDLVLFSTYGTQQLEEVSKLVHPIPVLSIEKYSGYHFTTAAFGMHLATEILNQKANFLSSNTTPIKKVLVYNNFGNKNIGLTLLQAIET
ncbi:MAG: beta-ketoacyl synthase chain length factor [Vicingaceae bacterium]|nr:beta-ketoacyl synthase chain length factor [Vicingaceae bacterium]